MKQHVLITAIAFTLLLAACSARALSIMAPKPDDAGNKQVIPSKVQEPRSVITMAPHEIISWLAATLLVSASTEQTSDCRVSALNADGDQRADASQAQVDGAAASDPWGIRTKASLAPKSAYVPGRSGSDRHN